MSSYCIGKTIDLPAQRFSYDPSRGETQAERFEGTLEACFAHAMGLRNQRPDLSFDLESLDGPLWSITVRSPDFANDPGTQTVATWELLGNDIQKEMYEAPFTLGVSETQIDNVRKAMLNETKIVDATTTVPAADRVTDPSAIVLLQLLKHGHTAFQVSQYVLRHTQLLSLKSQVQASFTNVERVYGHNQAFANLIGIPPEILFSIQQIPTPSVPNATLYHAGWLKKTPTVTQVSGNKFEIIQEYWLEAWAKAVYPAAT